MSSEEGQKHIYTHEQAFSWMFFVQKADLFDIFVGTLVGKWDL
jgi:hypothetical protein